MFEFFLCHSAPIAPANMLVYYALAARGAPRGPVSHEASRRRKVGEQACNIGAQ